MPQPVEQPIPVKRDLVRNGPKLVLININPDADQVGRNVQQNNCGGGDKIANVVEHILSYNGINVGLHRPNFLYAFSKYVL